MTGTASMQTTDRTSGEGLTRLRRAALLIPLVALLVVTVVSASKTGPSQGTREGRVSVAASDPWAPLRVSGLEAEAYNTLRQMAQAADLVVLGRFSSASRGETIYGDTSAGNVDFVVGRLQVLRTLQGSSDSANVSVRFLVVEQGEPISETISSTVANFPTGPVVVFLRRLTQDRTGDGTYRVVNTFGLWARTDRAELDTPLRVGDEESYYDYSAELADYTTLDAFANAVKSW